MITNVIQKGKNVIVYVNGSQRAQINVSSTPGSGLQNWNSNTFSVQQGSSIITYDETGNQIDQTYTGAIKFGERANSSTKREKREKTGFIAEVKDLIKLILRWIFFIVFMFVLFFVLLMFA